MKQSKIKNKQASVIQWTDSKFKSGITYPRNASNNISGKTNTLLGRLNQDALLASKGPDLNIMA